MRRDAEPAPRILLRAWDLPIRLCHWLLVVFVAVSWWSGETRELGWHRYSGYAILGLVLFRIYWGFAGSSTALFRNFVRGPRTVARYLREIPSARPSASLSHNPIGGWSVIAMLAVLGVQVAAGLIAVDVDGIESGPLADLVSFEAGRAAARLHAATFDVLLALLALHVAAMVYYALRKRENLVAAMLSGIKRVPANAGAPVRLAPAWRVAIGIVLAAFIVLALVTRLRF